MYDKHKSMIVGCFVQQDSKNNIALSPSSLDCSLLRLGLRVCGKRHKTEMFLTVAACLKIRTAPKQVGHMIKTFSVGSLIALYDLYMFMQVDKAACLYVNPISWPITQMNNDNKQRPRLFARNLYFNLTPKMCPVLNHHHDTHPLTPLLKQISSLGKINFPSNIRVWMNSRQQICCAVTEPAGLTKSWSFRWFQFVSLLTSKNVHWCTPLSSDDACTSTHTNKYQEIPRGKVPREYSSSMY